MNQLTRDQRTRVIHLLCEGNSLRSTTRLTGVHRSTIQTLLVQLGAACSAYQDKVFRNLTCKRIQCDEIWSFVGCKEKNATPAKKAMREGDVWTWTAIDADTKLIPCWYLGTRDGMAAYHFIHDLAERLASRVQLTTDGHKAYLTAVEDAFGSEIDYAMLNKIYGQPETGPETRYSPAQCMGAKKAVITGAPVFEHISTSFVERSNLNMRMCNRRFARLTNAFSKKIGNHEAAAALFFMHYNFCKIHGTLRCTPAMAAGITTKIWEVADIIALLDAQEKAA